MPAEPPERLRGAREGRGEEQAGGQGQAVELHREQPWSRAARHLLETEMARDCPGEAGDTDANPEN